MKIVDLHPEDLFDKELLDELTDSERARLEAHLERCSTCRFEREVRADFADELAGPRPGASLGLAPAPPAEEPSLRDVR